MREPRPAKGQRGTECASLVEGQRVEKIACMCTHPVEPHSYVPALHRQSNVDFILSQMTSRDATLSVRQVEAKVGVCHHGSCLLDHQYFDSVEDVTTNPGLPRFSRCLLLFNIRHAADKHARAGPVGAQAAEGRRKRLCTACIIIR